MNNKVFLERKKFMDSTGCQHFLAPALAEFNMKSLYRNFSPTLKEYNLLITNLNLRPYK
jgi:hypothetical protein